MLIQEWLLSFQILSAKKRLIVVESLKASLEKKVY